jgi:hypothetical protein
LHSFRSSATPSSFGSPPPLSPGGRREEGGLRGKASGPQGPEGVMWPSAPWGPTVGRMSSQARRGGVRARAVQGRSGLAAAVALVGANWEGDAALGLIEGGEGGAGSGGSEAGGSTTRPGAFRHPACVRSSRGRTGSHFGQERGQLLLGPHGLRGDADVPAGGPGVVAVGPMELEPSRPEPALTAQGGLQVADPGASGENLAVDVHHAPSMPTFASSHGGSCVTKASGCVQGGPAPRPSGPGRIRAGAP